MRSLLMVTIIVVALFMTGGLCEDSSPAEEETTSDSAAERLQEPRQMMKGNINENLDELERDLNEVGAERHDRLEENIRNSTNQ